MDKLVNKVKEAVSRNKIRYTEGEYNLDLSYIKPNLIAMGFPAERLEGYYRNNMEDVVRFLEEKHKDHYKVYNLCCERSYDVNKFHCRVATFPMVDHNPPHIQLIEQFCEDVDHWLGKHKDNVAVVHCKAGKGRTGVMISAYLLHTGISPSASAALDFYDKTRTHNHKGVTIPSQRRYVHYYDKLSKKTLGQRYQPTPLLLKGIKLVTIPKGMTVAPLISISKANCDTDSFINKLYESTPVENINKFEHEVCLELPEKVCISGDTLVCFYNKPKMKLSKERMFQFWFNTFFVRDKGTQLANGTSLSTLSCKLTDGPKYTGEKDKLKRHASAPVTCDQSAAAAASPQQQQLPPIEKKLRAAQSFTFDESQCLVLRLKKYELDKANKDRNHKDFEKEFEVICYFETTSDLSRSPSIRPVRPLEPVESDNRIEEDDLSDTDTEDELSPSGTLV